MKSCSQTLWRHDRGWDTSFLTLTPNFKTDIKHTRIPSSQPRICRRSAVGQPFRTTQPTRARRAGPRASPGGGNTMPEVSGCFHARNSFTEIENESSHSHLLLFAKERARSPHKSHSISPPLSILSPLPGKSEGGGSEGQQVVGERQVATSRQSSQG